MKPSLSYKQPVVGIAGHAGCGHCHSHANYAQDDSGGLSVVLTLFKEATEIDLTVKNIDFDENGYVTITTASGGVGTACSGRGFTVQEIALAKLAIAKECIKTQAICMESFGRYYGQGVNEPATALQTALANAALDSFTRSCPENFYAETESIEGNVGKIAGTVLDIGGITAAVLGTVNATHPGIGPVEDLEGNVFAGSKKKVMGKLGMDRLPTFILEGKVYSPLFSGDDNYFLVRADEEEDNPFVAEALLQAAKKLNYPAIYRKDVMKRRKKVLQKSTQDVALKIADAAKRLGKAELSKDKVLILSEIAKLVSEDAAGMSFMSNSLHEIVGGIGVMPGTGAVLSYIVSNSYKKKFISPYLTDEDVKKMTDVVKNAMLCINLEKACACLEGRIYKGDLDRFI